MSLRDAIVPVSVQRTYGLTFILIAVGCHLSREHERAAVLRFSLPTHNPPHSLHCFCYVSIGSIICCLVCPIEGMPKWQRGGYVVDRWQDTAQGKRTGAGSDKARDAEEAQRMGRILPEVKELMTEVLLDVTDAIFGMLLCQMGNTDFQCIHSSGHVMTGS
jgi:hypothetical protein